MTKAEREAGNMETRLSEAELLKRAVEFSQAKLDQLRAGDVMNLKDDLWGLTGHDEHDSREKFLNGLTDQQLAKIQADFKSAFTALVDGEQSVMWKAEKAIVLGAFAESRSERFTYGMDSPDVREAANVALIATLITSGATPEQFRRCPECGNLFFLDRKPDGRNFYCSRPCAVRVAVRNSRKQKTKRRKRAAAR